MRWSTVLTWVAALGVGAAIAWMDSRPGWDDTGITAASLLLAGTLFGAIAPRRPWRWGLAIGCWIPALALRRGAGSPWMLLVVAIPTVGALAAAGLRRTVTATDG